MLEAIKEYCASKDIITCKECPFMDKDYCIICGEPWLWELDKLKEEFR